MEQDCVHESLDQGLVVEQLGVVVRGSGLLEISRLLVGCSNLTRATCFLEQETIYDA